MRPEYGRINQIIKENKSIELHVILPKGYKFKYKRRCGSFPVTCKYECLHDVMINKIINLGFTKLVFLNKPIKFNDGYDDYLDCESLKLTELPTEVLRKILYEVDPNFDSDNFTKLVKLKSKLNRVIKDCNDIKLLTIIERILDE